MKIKEALFSFGTVLTISSAVIYFSDVGSSTARFVLASIFGLIGLTIIVSYIFSTVANGISDWYNSIIADKPSERESNPTKSWQKDGKIDDN